MLEERRVLGSFAMKVDRAHRVPAAPQQALDHGAPQAGVEEERQATRHYPAGNFLRNSSRSLWMRSEIRSSSTRADSISAGFS